MDASPGQFPYQALLNSFNYGNESYGELCGGSLISRNFVLTATHCVINTDATTVYLGVTYFQDMSTAAVYTVDHNTNVRQHSGYNPQTSENDIAIVKLPEMVTPTRYIKTIALPKLAWANPDTFNNYVVTASGFGQTYNNDRDTPHEVLQYANLYKMPQADCRAAFDDVKVTDGMICVDKRVFAGVCPGDSGGPLAVRYQSVLYVIGVADWIYGGCVNRYPGVFTNVAYYLKWINQLTGIPIS